MKKLFLILLLLPHYAYAGDTFKYNFNIATVGVGLDYFSESDYNGEFFVELLSVGMEHKDTKIGISLSPLKYWNFSFEKDEQKLSFLNFNANWNMLYKKGLFLGPFWSINYLILENEKMKMNDCIFTCGIRFSWSFNIFKNDIFYHFISAELGYRSIDGINKIHFNIAVDFITLLYSLAYYGTIFN